MAGATKNHVRTRGCSLMGLAKNARDPAKVSGKHNRSDEDGNTRQLRLTGNWLSLLRRGVPVSSRRGVPRSEEDEWVDFVFGHESSFPQRR